MTANLTKAEQLTEELKIAKRHAKQLAELSREARDRVQALIHELLAGDTVVDEERPTF